MSFSYTAHKKCFFLFVSACIYSVMLFVSQLQKVGIEVASRQKPRQQGGSGEEVQRAVRGI